MGGGSSREASQRLVEVAPKQAGGWGPEYPGLGRQELQAALSKLAAICKSENTHIRLVTIGGAVDTLLTKSRAATRELVLIGELVPDQEGRLLSGFARQVAKKHPKLGDGWLNNRVGASMEPHLRRMVQEQAVEQRAVVFEQPGLTIYAVPWKYAFLSNVDSLSKLGPRAMGPHGLDEAVRHDVSGAAHYLHIILRAENRSQVKINLIKYWQHSYRMQSFEGLENACRLINDAYQRSFGSRPITG